MRNLISSPFHSIWAFISYVLIFVAPIWALVSFLGSVDFVMSYAEPIVGVLHSWWGVIALIIAGFVLLAWDSSRRQSENTTSLDLVAADPREGAAQHPVLPEVNSEEVEKLKDELREVEQEYATLQKAHEELEVENDALNQENEQLAGHFLQEGPLREHARNLSIKLFGLAKTRENISQSLQVRLGAAQKADAAEDVRKLAQEKSYREKNFNLSYQQDFEPSIRALLTDLERQGWCDAEERREIGSLLISDSGGAPSNEQIRQGAARIAAFGKRLL